MTFEADCPRNGEREIMNTLRLLFASSVLCGALHAAHAAGKVALEKLRTQGLTERERQVLGKGISNLEFHYLGSAKILGGIGKGLAEAMAELKQFKLAK
jgi:hypothetical protein